MGWVLRVTVGWAGENLRRASGLNFPPVVKEEVHAQAFCSVLGPQEKGRLKRK